VPRSGFGCWSLGAWLALLGAFTGLFVWVVVSKPPPGQLAASIVIFTLLTLAWSLAMIRWMYLRSEVIDMNELLRLRKQLEQKERGRR
jgi:uncharacterized membrane protein YccC